MCRYVVRPHTSPSVPRSWPPPARPIVRLQWDGPRARGVEPLGRDANDFARGSTAAVRGSDAPVRDIDRAIRSGGETGWERQTRSDQRRARAVRRNAHHRPRSRPAGFPPRGGELGGVELAVRAKSTTRDAGQPGCPFFGLLSGHETPHDRLPGTVAKTSQLADVQGSVVAAVKAGWDRVGHGRAGDEVGHPDRSVRAHFVDGVRGGVGDPPFPARGEYAVGVSVGRLFDAEFLEVFFSPPEVDVADVRD